MRDKDRTKAQLVDELIELRRRIADLEAAETERKRAEEALQKSQNNLQTLFDSLDDFLFILDSEGHIIEVNPVVQRRLGYTKGELVGKSVLQVHPPDQHEEAAAIIADMMAGKQDMCPIPVIAKDGTLIPVETKVTLGQWNGQPALFGVSRDIIERKRAEEGQRKALAEALQATHALRESEEKYRDLVENVNDVIYTVDRNGVITYVSPAIESFIGYRPSEVIDRPFATLIYHQDFDRIRENLEILLAGHSPGPSEYRILNKSGEIRWMRTSSRPIFERNRVVGMQGILADITERKQAEEAQRESEEKYSMLFNEMLTGLSLHEIILDDNGKPVDYRFLDVNPAFEKHTGLKKEDIVGKTVLEVLPGTEPIWIETSGQVALSGETVHFEHYSSEIGKYYEVFTFCPKKGQFANLSTDITERKKIEEELEKHREGLEELVEERTRELEQAQAELVRQERLSVLGQLTATVAHEIRNPLGTVRTSVFAIGDAIEHNQVDRVKRALQLAERNITRCDSIIAELLDYTRDRVLQLRPTPIDTWLETVLDEQAIPADIICIRELTSGIEIPIDREHFRRAVINVVENGIDALQDKRARGNQLTVSAHVTGNRLEIRISDTGCGIPDDVMDKVFEPLFSTKSFGVGLGLAIVKNIMEQHSGGVEITSKLGEGTTVTLWILMPDNGEN